jgi:hypothetical protein
MARGIATFFLGCVVVAGLVGGLSVKRTILWVQALPAALALLTLFAASGNAWAAPPKKHKPGATASKPLATPKPKPTPTPAPMIAGFAPDEMATLRHYEAQGYIKHATCAEIANSVLKESRLPELGESGPVGGERLDIDRRGERANPPVFLDGVILSRDPYIAIRLQSRSGGLESWNLKRIRELKEKVNKRTQTTTLESDFSFAVDARLNQQACELLSIEFKGTGYAETLDVHDCLAITGLDAATAASWVKNPRLFPWVKEDCDLGLQYFKAAKDALIEDAKRHTK